MVAQNERGWDGVPWGGAVQDGAAGGGVGGAEVARGAVGGRQVWARMVWVGLSAPAAGATAVRVSWLSSSAAAGRSCGSLDRAAVTWGRSESGTAAMSGASCRIRYRMTSEVPVPKGGCPLAA